MECAEGGEPDAAEMDDEDGRGYQVRGNVVKFRAGGRREARRGGGGELEKFERQGDDARVGVGGGGVDWAWKVETGGGGRRMLMGKGC